MRPGVRAVILSSLAIVLAAVAVQGGAGAGTAGPGDAPGGPAGSGAAPTGATAVGPVTDTGDPGFDACCVGGRAFDRERDGTTPATTDLEGDLGTAISGILTDRNGDRVGDTFVYVRNIRWDDGSEMVAIRPDEPPPGGVAGPNSTFTVTHVVDGPDAGTTAGDDPTDPVRGRETGVTRTELGSYEFGPNFPLILSHGPYKLAERSGPGDGEYTLKDVPAVPPADAAGPTTSYDVRGVVLAPGRAGRIGNATAATKPGFTDDANVAFGFRAAVNVTVEAGSLDAPRAVTEGATYGVSANLTNAGTGVGSVAVEYRLDADGDGTLEPDEALVANDSFELGAGETATITLEVPSGATAGANGTGLLHGVVVPGPAGGVNSSATGTVDVLPRATECEYGNPTVTEFALSEDDDCAVGTGELANAIDAWAAGRIGSSDLADVIGAWAAGG